MNLEQLYQTLIDLLKKLLVLLLAAHSVGTAQPQISATSTPLSTTSTAIVNQLTTSTATSTQPARLPIATSTPTSTPAQSMQIPPETMQTASQTTQPAASAPAPQPTPTPIVESTTTPKQAPKIMDYTITLKVFVNGVEATGQTFTGKTGEKFHITYQATNAAGEPMSYSVNGVASEVGGRDYSSDVVGDQPVSIAATGLSTGTTKTEIIHISLEQAPVSEAPADQTNA